jgi:hypothetical protein
MNPFPIPIPIPTPQTDLNHQDAKNAMEFICVGTARDSMSVS